MPPIPLFAILGVTVGLIAHIFVPKHQRLGAVTTTILATAGAFGGEYAATQMVDADHARSAAVWVGSFLGAAALVLAGMMLRKSS